MEGEEVCQPRLVCSGLDAWIINRHVMWLSHRGGGVEAVGFWNRFVGGVDRGAGDGKITLVFSPLQILVTRGVSYWVKCIDNGQKPNSRAGSGTS